MELLIATPLTRTELMVGKVLTYVVIGLLQTSVIRTLSVWLFAVSVLDVDVASALLVVANLSLGLLISMRGKSQFQATQMMMFVFLLSILLSGFMFAFAGMPKAAQWLAEVLPLTHFMRLIRGVMFRGGRPVRFVARGSGPGRVLGGHDGRGDSAVSQASRLIGGRKAPSVESHRGRGPDFGVRSRCRL